MTRTFHYRFYDGFIINVTVPIMNGFVRSNDFMPDFIKTAPFGLSIALQDINEFNTDCQKLVDEINANRWAYNADTSYYYALREIVQQHINNYGRLFFSDLMTYIDECCHLMYSFGFDAASLKSEIYLLLILSVLNEFKDYVKDGNPMFGVVPFASTSKYKILLQKIENLLQDNGMN